MRADHDRRIQDLDRLGAKPAAGRSQQVGRGIRATSVRREAAVHWRGHTEHEAGGRAAQPEGRCGDSSGRPGRPIGWSRIISFIASGWFSIMSAAMGVSIKPGQTALMRMPSGAESIAALLVSPITPCLVAWYVARPACPTRPPREES